MEEKKTIINAVPAGIDGCGHYRIVQPALIMQQLGADLTLSPAAHFRTFGQNITWTQRMCNTNLLERMVKYKETTNQKFVVDFDDLLWLHEGESLPDYNLCRAKVNSVENTAGMEKYLDKLADKITVSTDELKKSLLQFVDESKITIIPNMLAYKEWYHAQSPRPKKDIFYFAGSYTHYDNVNKKLGDFSQNLVHFLGSKKVIVKSLCPYFIKPEINYKASRLTTYANDFWKETRNVDFIIAPLANNVFNKCKSDLKYLESAAVGRVCLVSDFPGSPYSGAHPYQKIPEGTTTTGLKYIVERANEHYDEILKYQYEYLNKRWLDSNIGLYSEVLK